MKGFSSIRRLRGGMVVGLLLAGAGECSAADPAGTTSATGSAPTTPATAEAQRLADFVVIESPGRDPVQEPWLPSPSQCLSLSSGKSASLSFQSIFKAKTKIRQCFAKESSCLSSQRRSQSSAFTTLYSQRKVLLNC